MFLFLLPSKLLKIAKDLSRLPGTFNKWASEHIVRELSNFLTFYAKIQNYNMFVIQKKAINISQNLKRNII